MGLPALADGITEKSFPIRTALIVILSLKRFYCRHFQTAQKKGKGTMTCHVLTPSHHFQYLLTPQYHLTKLLNWKQLKVPKTLIHDAFHFIEMRSHSNGPFGKWAECCEEESQNEDDSYGTSAGF